MSKNARKQAIAEHQAAKQHLAAVSQRDRTETDEYLAANQQVVATEQRVPWWRR
jgi:hypothetical protein